MNKKLKRRGQLVMDRFKSPRIEDDRHLLGVMTYIDLNQYRAGKVKHPKENEYSSFAYYAYGKEDKLITPAPSYLALAETCEARQMIYLDMVNALLEQPRPINISDTYFIGDPDWVIAKFKELRSAFLPANCKKGLSPPP